MLIKRFSLQLSEPSFNSAGKYFGIILHEAPVFGNSRQFKVRAKLSHPWTSLSGRFQIRTADQFVDI